MCLNVVLGVFDAIKILWKSGSLHERIASMRGTYFLAYLVDMSRLLRSVHHVFHFVARSGINRHSNTHDIAIVAQVDMMRGRVVR